MHQDIPAAARRGRYAVAAMFLVNGFMTGSWVPQIPVVLSRLHISESTLGLLILCFGLGALVSMPWSGFLTARFGTRAVLRAFAFATPFGLPLVALAPGVWSTGAALFVFGALIGSMDVAMNANAVVVEEKLSRAIMSSSHAFWSIGGFIGGGLGGVIVQHGGYLLHAGLACLAGLALAAAAAGYLVAETRMSAKEREAVSFPRAIGIYLVGLIALFCMVPEGAVLDWAALYLREEHGVGLSTASLAFACFAGAMAVVRFLGDGIRNHLGAVRTLRFSAAVAAAGLCIAALAPSAWPAIAAFALCGAGIANTVPIAFSAAGRYPGVATGTGMAAVTTLGYSGILLAPFPIGIAAEHIGFWPIFLGLSLLLVAAAAMAPLARAADPD